MDEIIKMDNINYKVDYAITKRILYIIIFFPLLGENIISTALSDTMSKILSIISCLCIFIYLITRKKINISIFTAITLILTFLHLFITFILSPSTITITSANNMITPYGLIAYSMLFLYIDFHIENKKELIAIFKSIMIIMTISVMANLILNGDLSIANNLSVFKEAISTGYTNSRKWLFGHRNMIFVHHLLWMSFTFITYRLENKKYFKIYIFQILFTLLVGVISWNSTMILTTIIVFILSIFKNSWFIKILIKNYFISYLGLEIGIVFLRIQDVFSFIIVKVLHRNLSFTGRTNIWDYYIKQFNNGSIFNKLFGNFGVTELTVNSHNMFLGLMSFTGIIGLSLYLLLIIVATRELNKAKMSEPARFMSIIIFGFLINSLTMEFYLQPLLALYIGFRINKLTK